MIQDPIPLCAPLTCGLLTAASPALQPGHLVELEAMAPVEVLRSNDEHGLHWAKAYVGQPIRCALLPCCSCCWNWLLAIAGTKMFHSGAVAAA